jgi:hypothetical protein
MLIYNWWSATMISRYLTVILAAIVFALVFVGLVSALRSAHAQAPQVAPGWFVTGEWQCGPHVRIVTSTDGGDGIDFLIIGAWFDNHYTLRRGQLFYNGTPCAAVGFPIGGPAPRRESERR